MHIAIDRQGQACLLLSIDGCQTSRSGHTLQCQGIEIQTRLLNNVYCALRALTTGYSPRRRLSRAYACLNTFFSNAKMRGLKVSGSIVSYVSR